MENTAFGWLLRIRINKQRGNGVSWSEELKRKLVLLTGMRSHDRGCKVPSHLLRLISTAFLLVILTACGSNGYLPTNQLVQKAIAIQLQQTQQQLSQQLSLDFQGFEINRLKITQEKSLTIQNLPAYRLKGTYNLVFKLPKRKLTQPEKPFEVYLQLQKEGKTWRLLLPQKDSKDSQPNWRSYLIEG